MNKAGGRWKAETWNLLCGMSQNLCVVWHVPIVGKQICVPLMCTEHGRILFLVK